MQEDQEDRGNEWRSPSQVNLKTIAAKSLSESERFIENLNDSINNRHIALQNALQSVNSSLLNPAALLG